MSTFRYKGFNVAGKRKSGLVEALDAKEAGQNLRDSGILVEQLVRVGAVGTSRRRGSLDAAMRPLFYRELAALLQAGLPMAEALGSLARSPEMGAAAPLMAELRDAIREGRSLADALSDSVPRTRGHESATLNAGERTGTLIMVLNRLADFIESQNSVRDRLLTALLYPSVVLVMAVLIVVGLLGFALPHLTGMLGEETALELPLLTRIVMAAGRAFRLFAPPLAVGLAALFFYLRHLIAHDEVWAGRLRRLLFCIPLVAPALTILVNVRFADTLALLLRGGVPLVEGVRLAGDAVGNLWLRDLIRQEAESIRQGDSFADALSRIPPLAATLPGWVRIGEAGGNLPELLETAARHYGRQWERFLSRRLVLLEPILILGIGVFVLITVLAILLPILSLDRLLHF